MKRVFVLAVMTLCILRAESQPYAWKGLRDGVTDPQGFVRTMCYDSMKDELFVAGDFGSIDSLGAICFAWWNGSIWDNFGITGQGSGFHNGNYISCSAYHDSSLYWAIGGTNPGNHGITKKTDTVFQGFTANGSVYGMCVWGDSIVVVGEFTKVDGITCNGIAVYDTRNDVWHSLGQGVTSGSLVDCCCVWNGNLIVGGIFCSVDNINSNGVIMHNGMLWVSLGGGLATCNLSGQNPQVSCVAPFQGNLYAGLEPPGAFSNFYKWDGSTWNSVPLPFSSSITCLYATDTILYMPSKFDGTNVTFFNDGPTGSIYAIGSYHGELIFGGSFTYNQSHTDTFNCIARYTDDTFNIAAPLIQKDDITLSPNPAAQNITLNYLEPNSSISIYNLQGECIMKKVVITEETEIDVSDLPSGVYLLQIENAEGVVVKKVVKEAPAP